MEVPLAILKGCRIPRDVEIDSLPYVVGRSRNANFVIAHINVSRNHCHFVRQNLTWSVIDYSSSGTYVNGELVGKTQSRVLKAGDVIRFGSPESDLCWTFDLVNECVSEEMDINGVNGKILPTKRNPVNMTNGIHRVILKEEDLGILNRPHSKRRESRESHEKNGTVDCQLHKISDIVQTERVPISNEVIGFHSKSEITDGKIKVKVEAKIYRNQSNTTGEKKGDLQNNSFISKENENEITKITFCLPKVNVVESSSISLPQKSCETNGIIEPGFSKNLLRNNEQEKVNDEHYLCLPKKARIEKEPDVEVNETKKTEDLMKELEKLKSALTDLKHKNSALEGELAAASNSKNEALQFKSDLLGNLADLMEDELQCTICSELFVQAITLGCTHTFCKFCIGQWMKKQKTCPICRKKITSETRSLVVDNYIDKMVGNLSVQLKERREAVIAERKGALHKKRVRRRRHGAHNFS